MAQPQARRLDPRRHVGQLVLHRLEIPDGAAERRALLGIAHRLLHGRLGQAERLAADADAPRVQGDHGALEPLAFATQEVLLRHPAVVQDHLARGHTLDPHQVLLGAGREAGRPLLHQEQRDALVSFAFVHGRHDDGQIGQHGTGDEPLGAVQDVAIPLELGRGLDAGHIRACAGLGLGDDANLLARRHRRQVFLLLGLGPVLQDHVLHQRAEELDIGDHNRGPRHLLLCDRPAHDVHPGAAVLGGQGHPQEAQFRHPLPEIPGELVRPVDLGRAWLDFLFREFPHHLLHHPLRVAQLEIHAYLLWTVTPRTL